MFLNLFLNLTTVFLICSFFENLFLFFIIYFALIVLNCTMLSLFCAFNSQNIIILSSIEFISSIIFWFKLKKKLYFPKFDKKIFNALKIDKSLIVFAFFFLLMLFSLLIVAIYSPPLEPDSRMYHFVRIFQYIKQASFNHFLTNEARNIVMPFNSEMVYSYFYIFKKTDTGFGLLSYFSFVFSLFGFYKIFENFNIPIRKILFAIFSMGSFSIILVQIPSLQTDILVGSLIIASIALFIDYCKTDKQSCCYFSALSYALAFGVKTTSIIFFLSYLIIIFSYLKIKKICFSKIKLYIAFLILNFLIFSGYNYILNFLEFGNFITNDMLKIEHTNSFNIKNLIYNMTYLVCDFIGFKIGFLGNFLNGIKDSIISSIGLEDKNPLTVIFDERTVGFSFAGIFIFIPCLISSFINKNKRYSFFKICSLTFIINFLILILVFPYSQYLIRYFTTMFMISAFCLSFGYKNKIYKIFIMILLSSNLVLYSFYSSRCPLRYILGQNLFNIEEVKENIITKKQKNLSIYLQYKFLQEFKNNYKKEDKIALLNNDEFYELKQLSALGYNIDALTSDYIYENDISEYKYIFLIKKYSDYQQKNDNYKKEEINKKYGNDYFCKHYVDKINGKIYPIAKICFFNSKLLNTKGFKLYKRINIENKFIDIYDKI